MTESEIRNAALEGENMQASDRIEKACGSVPWRRGEWHGSWIALDGAKAGPFEAHDVAEALFTGAEGLGEYEGCCACIMRLKDGRFVAYESTWGPTGSGFSEDAYGGDACVHFAQTLETAATLGLTEDGRKLCGYKSSSAPAPCVSSSNVYVSPEREFSHCEECGCKTGGGNFCYEHKPYMVHPKKDGTFRWNRHGRKYVSINESSTPAQEQAPDKTAEGVDGVDGENSIDLFCFHLNRILDGKDDGAGVANEPWESARRRLLKLQSANARMRKALEEIITMPCDETWSEKYRDGVRKLANKALKEK